MNESNCENILMAEMARADGEEISVSLEKINSHFSNCEGCRREVEEMKSVGNLLKTNARREQTANLWAAIEKRIEKTESALSWRPFVLLAVLLIVYKLLEMLPARDFGLIFKLAPLVVVVALFVFIKENPFKIKTEFVLEN